MKIAHSSRWLIFAVAGISGARSGAGARIAIALPEAAATPVQAPEAGAADVAPDRSTKPEHEPGA